MRYLVEKKNIKVQGIIALRLMGTHVITYQAILPILMDGTINSIIGMSAPSQPWCLK